MSAEKRKAVVFTFGRFQAPHAGHHLLVSKVLEVARKYHADNIICVSATENKYPATSRKVLDFTDKKYENPLTVEQKLKYLNSMFATDSSRSAYKPNFVSAEKYGRNMFGLLKALCEDEATKYDTVIGVFGSDRVGYSDDQEAVLREQLGVRALDILTKASTMRTNIKRYYPHVVLVAAGETRNAQANNVTGASGTRMRMYAMKNDAEQFVKYCKVGKMTEEICREMMEDIRAAYLNNGFPLPPQVGGEREPYRLRSDELPPRDLSSYELRSDERPMRRQKR